MLHDDFFDHYGFTPEQRRAIEVFYIRSLVENAADKNFERTANEFLVAGLLHPPYPDCLIIADLQNGLSVLYLLTGGQTFVEYAHSRRAGFLERHPDRTVRFDDGELFWTTEQGFHTAAIVIASLMTLCMKSMNREQVDITAALNKRRAERGRSELVPYTIITNPQASGSAIGTHASPMPHWRRGHIRRYKNGRTIVIEPTLVNAQFGPPTKRTAYLA